MMKRKKGFTLIEVMVVVALISILMGIISVFVINSSRFASDSKKNFNSLSEARIAMSYLTMKIREHDTEGCMTFKDNSLNIKGNSSPEDTKKIDKYYVYFKEGQLIEKDLTIGKENSIAKINSFEMERVKDKDKRETQEVNIKIGYLNKDNEELFLEGNLTTNNK
ncbi:prepilin-type N-terminal cleavage/methylation domain-containing protein [Hathewaya histolytica]|uniref:prepilin-type N-terminal cleavage/methylation domain-containing protein n=1 Tax=Hathewaya histolytica TaxID=1498 RepID=UPI003B6734D0